MSLRVYSLFRALSFQGTAAESISPTNGQSQMRLVEFDQCRYRRQLLQLQQQGFLDEEQNVRALLRADGNVLSAVEYLVDDGSVRDDTRGQQDSQLRVSEDSLPFEIWTKIFEYLNPSNDLTFSSHLAALRDYHAVSLTCKGFYAAVMPLMHQTLIANPAAGCGCTATLIRDSLDRPSKKAHRESSDRLKRMSTDLARRYARLVMFNTNKKCIACPYATRLFLQHLASFKRIQQAYIHDVCFTNSTLFLFLKFETLPIPYLHLNACDVAASIQTEDVIRVPVSSLRIDVGWHASAARSPTLASGAAKLVHAFVVEGSLSSLCIDFQACEQTKEIVGALTERKLVLRKLKSLKLTNRFPLSDPYGMRLNPNAAPHLHRWILKDILPFCMSLTRLDLSQMRFDVSFAAPLDPQHLPCLIELSCLYDFLPLVSLCRTLRDLHLRCCTSVDLKRGIGQLLEGHAAALEDVESLRVHVPNMTEQLYTSIALACPKLKWLHFSSTTDYWTWQELPLEGEHREAFPGGRRWMDFRVSKIIFMPLNSLLIGLMIHLM